MPIIVVSADELASIAQCSLCRRLSVAASCKLRRYELSPHGVEVVHGMLSYASVILQISNKTDVLHDPCSSRAVQWFCCDSIASLDRHHLDLRHMWLPRSEIHMALVLASLLYNISAGRT